MRSSLHSFPPATVRLAALLAFAGASSAYFIACSTSGPSGPSGTTLTLGGDSLLNGTYNAVYYAQFSASGGTAPYTFSVKAPQPLPPGLSLSTDGVLSGTPTMAGSYTPTIQAGDAARDAGEMKLSITIYLAISPVQLPPGTINVLYGQQQLGAAGAVGTVTWSVPSGTLPPGLSLSPAGLLSGTPTTLGTFPFSFQAVDGSGNVGTLGYLVNIFGPPGPLTITTASPLPRGTVTYAYNRGGRCRGGRCISPWRFAATGGTAPYTWALAPGSGPLPSGLTLGATGLLQGTPTDSGTLSFVIQVTDAAIPANTATKTFSLTVVDPPIGITTNSLLPGGTVGAAYSLQFETMWGEPPIIWVLESCPSCGSLPPGLVFDVAGATAGLLHGTPTAAGTFSFVVGVSDTRPGGGSSTANTFQLTISP